MADHDFADRATADRGVHAAADRAVRRWLGDDLAGPPTACAASGFSGAGVYLVSRRSTGERFILKAFAAATPPARAAWVHGLMRHLRQAGVREVAGLIETPGAARQTLVAEDGTLWELSQCIVGRPIDEPTPAQAAAATTVLARLHRAAATLPDAAAVAPSPGLVRRVEQALRLAARPWDAAGFAMVSDTASHRRVEAADDLAAQVRTRFARAAGIFDRLGGRRAVAGVAGWSAGPLPTQAVLRDCWCDHVLFATDAPARVAGVIDFHAAGIDTPAIDLARLLGSWGPPAGPTGSGSLLDRWADAIAAYEAVRPLTATERRLIDPLAATAVVFGLDNWFRWTLTEGRSFAHPAAVLRRIDLLVAGLPDALARLHDLPAAGPL